jgi:diketogulonate reductase-like aldo/keto reductase
MNPLDDDSPPQTRRDAIKLGLGAGASILFADACARQTPAPAADAPAAHTPAAETAVVQPHIAPMSTLIRKKIPSSGELIPVIGLGSSQTFNLTPQSPEYPAALDVLRLFKALGGTVIDTAPTYQRSEIFLGEALQTLGLTNDIFISTKVNVGPAGKAAALQQMEGSSRVYGRRTVDLMQVWNLGDSVRSLTDTFLQTHLDAATEWKATGRARYIGITTSRDPQYADVEEAMKRYKLDFVQLDYSIDDRIPDQRLLPLAEEKGIAVLVNRPFSTGLLFRRVAGKALPPWAAEFDCTSWAQYFLKFIVSHPAVTCVIPATNDPVHLRDNMGACVGRLPDAATRERMIQYYEQA